MIKSLIIFRPAGATGWKEEPVHEDPGAVVVGVIGQQAVPLVLLLAGAVPVTPQGRGHAETRKLTSQCSEFMNISDA